MMLYHWARRWNLPAAALAELNNLFNLSPDVSRDTNVLNEQSVLNRVKKEASEKNIRLWRNNVGATYTQNGAFIRYGLANDSTALNKKIKSADLVGIRPVKITSDMTGLVIGQFVSREIKKSGWVYTGTERERAQLNWAEFIVALGGDACFANDIGTL